MSFSGPSFRFLQRLAVTCAVAVLPFAVPQVVKAEENPQTLLGSTVLSGFVDSSAHWSLAPTVLTNIRFVIEGTTAGGVRQPGEPRHNFHTNGVTAWISWQAPASGCLKLSIAATNPAVVSVYTGATVDALTLVQRSVQPLPGGPAEASQRLQAHPYWTNSTLANGVAGEVDGGASLEFLGEPLAASWCATQMVVQVTAGQRYHIVVAGPVIRTALTNAPYVPDGEFTLHADLTTFKLQSPADGQMFLTGAPVPLAVTTIDPAVDGEITRVDYYSGSNWIGSASAPFALDWPNAPAGYHAIRAVATNSLGAVRETEVATVRVLPGNDLFALASVLPNAPFAFASDLGAASREPDEPVHAGNGLGRTLWWKWTPTADGDLNLSTAGSAGPVSISVYEGDALGQLTLLSSNIHLWCSERCGCGWRARTSFGFHGKAGRTYHLAVDKHRDFVAGVGPVVPGATPPGGTGGVLGGGGGVLAPQPVVYTNQFPNGVQPLVLTAEGIVVLRQAAPAPAMFTVESYPIQLAGTFVPAPANDNFAASSPLAGSNLHVTGSNVAAGKEAGEPVHAGNPGGRSVWYSWTAPASGHVWLSTNPPPALLQPRWQGVTEVVFQNPGNLTTYLRLTLSNGGNGNSCGDEFDGSPPPPFFPVFGVYTGGSVAALTPVGSGTNGLWFEAVQGRTYRIAVDGNLGSAGAFAFHLAQFPAPPNDAFAGRIAVAGTKIDLEGNNVSAGADAAGPAHSVWWSWTAPAFGVVQLTGTGSDAEFPLAVFTGNTIGELQTVAAGLGGVSFNATLGTTYQIALGSANGTVGNYHLQLTSPPVVIVAPLVTPNGFQRVLNGFPGENGQLLLIQSRSSSQGAWNNVALAQVKDGMAKPASLPASFPFWHEFRALVVETPFTLPRPVMRHTGLQPDGSYRLCIEGLPGLKCVIKTSTNLVDWEAVMTHTFGGGPFDYFHPASSDPQRYYRAEPVIE